MNNGKIRIYELSKELNLENREILTVCEQLGIAVKSHSSTIGDEEASKIRAQAPSLVADRSSSQSPDTQSSKPALKVANRTINPKPAVKQQQILEIRRPTSAPTDVSSHSSAESEHPESDEPLADLGQPTPNELVRPVSPQTSSPKVASATAPSPSAASAQRPAAKPAAQRPVSPSRPAVRPSSPEARPEAPAPVEPSPKAESKPPAKVAAKAAPKPAPRPMPAPLASPPPRPTEVKEAVGSKSADIRAVTSGPPTPRPKPTVGRVVADEASSERPRPARPGSPAGVRPVKKDVGGDRNQRSVPPQIVELQRPKPMRPSAPSVGRSGTDVDEDTDDLPVLDAAPVRPTADLDRPRRPAAPARPARRGPQKGRAEEYEDGESRKKVANHPKRRVHIIGDDDDDFDQGLGGDDEMSAAISLSLARPAKPKSLQSPVSKPTSTLARRRPSRGGGAKQRREHQKAKAEKPGRPEMILIKGGMTVQELSMLLATPETDIIRTLFFKGIAATITQTLDLPTVQLVCEELDVLVEIEEQQSAARKLTEVISESDLDSLVLRPPVVTIMGHVDHGKTTLLDSIRKTKVVDGEAGGITQHIGAYHVDVDHNGGKQQIVFLDTPGHEAFTAMRARGTRVTDIAVLVVAADDGVRPQTLEAISHAKAAKVPLIVAINKIDKEGAQPDRVKQELTEHGLVCEEWGGDTMMVPVSALNGDNLDQLLENILLVAEIEELSANPDRPAKGTVIEANLDKGRGPIATLLIQNGTMRVGDVLVAGSVFGRVRAMIDDRGGRVDSAGPSFAVEVLGLNEVPAAGDEFDVYLDEKEARSLASDRADQQRESRLQQALASRRVTLNSLSARAREGELKELNLLLKSDVQGSLEAIIKSLDQLPQDEVQIRVLLASPGEITETDIDLAAASDAVILGFNTTLSNGAKRAADEVGVDVRDYDIIYNLLEDVQGAMEGLLEPELVEEPLGKIEVRAVFPVGRSAVAGCYIQSGKATRNCKIRVHRGSNVVYTGALDSLRRVREDVKEVNAGYECGIGVDKFNDWKEGDIIETYRMVTKRRTLSV
ncbi:MAG: translation initiation factor IF-2 [Synechococcales cyanobacterium CRU_2_2]|nr:translation initiation factor IF-2 [Synechococcales cyanobacterium CRU_2_2]